MSTKNLATKLVQVTTVDALLNDGSRIAWRSFRPAVAKPDTKPTVYFTNLTSNSDVGNSSVYDLTEIGLQARHHSVELELTSAGPVTLELADGKVVTLTSDDATFTVPARGEERSILLTFEMLTCSFEARPNWPISAKTGGPTLQIGDGEGDDGPPPPFPGSSNQNQN